MQIPVQNNVFAVPGTEDNSFYRDLQLQTDSHCSDEEDDHSSFLTGQYSIKPFNLSLIFPRFYF